MQTFMLLNKSTNTTVYSYTEMGKMIEKYENMGLSFIPCQYGSKKPFVQWTEYQSTKPSQEEIRNWKANYWLTQSNIAIVCGDVSGKFTPIDFDDKVKFHIAKAFYEVTNGIDITEETPVVKTSRGYHVWLKIQEQNFKGNLFSGIEIKGNGSLIQSPPSTHESGHVYEFLSPSIENILELDNLSDLGIDSATTHWATEITQQWVKDAIEGVDDGERNTTCYKLSLYFRFNMGLPKEVTLEIMEEWGTRCNPEYEEREIQTTVESAYSYEPPLKEDSAKATELEDDFIEIDTTKPVEKPQYKLEPIIPENKTTVIYGTGGIGKGYLAILFAICIQTDWQKNPFGFKVKKGNVLYLDYEDDKTEFENRIHEIKKAHNLPDFKITYRRCLKPLWQEIDGLSEKCVANNIDTIFIDSIGGACGGDLNSSETANKFYSNLNMLRGTKVAIGHPPKNNNKTELFGSAFFKYLGRSVWLATGDKAVSTKPILNITLKHKKVNRGRLQNEIKFQLQFIENNNNELDKVLISLTKGISNSKSKSKGKFHAAQNAIIKILQSKELKPGEIIELLKQQNHNASTINRAIRDLKKEGKITKEQGKIKIK